MSMTQKDVSTLLENNEEYRSLLEMHREYERQLEELTGRSYLSTEEEVKEHEIKKRKLALKDRMERIRQSLMASP